MRDGRREDDCMKRNNRLMLSVSSRALTTTVTAADANGSSAKYFVKDGRKISVGDCALFKSPQQSPPFIGIICWLKSDKENSFTLGLNRLYRPADVKLENGVALNAAPNEVFYSFQRDEVPAASILHPCKVAFLPRGAELPSGVSSFVCRQVYDDAKKCLCYLTDRGYLNDWHEEIDQLLRKTRRDMHVTVQQQRGTRSPKPVCSSAAVSPSKQCPDVMQSNANFRSQAKGKKRDRGDQASESNKHVRGLNVEDPCQMRSESMLKSEIAKISDKGGLVDSRAVVRLVQLMQPEKPESKLVLACRSMLAGVIAATDKHDCLCQFLQLKGLPIIDEWLQEVHKGNVCDSSNHKDTDKYLEDFLLVILCALDKLPINLNALQSCNIGKSVNCLRSHKNLEIQKKARSLVDTWKKRVEFEMNMKDAKSGSSQAVSWSSKSHTDVSHGGSRQLATSSEAVIRSSAAPSSSSKSASPKVVQGEIHQKSVSATLGAQKSPASPASTGSICKDGPAKISTIGVCEPPLVVREDKSSSSSHSLTNSQCSSDLAKNIIPSLKEVMRSSGAGSRTRNNIATGPSRHRNSSNSVQGTVASGIQRETGSGRKASSTKVSALDRLSKSEVTIDDTHKLMDGNASSMDGNSHKLIVKISNRGRNAAHTGNSGCVDTSSCRTSRASSPARSEKNELGANLREKSEVKTKESDNAPVEAPNKVHSMNGNDIKNVSHISMSADLSTRNDSKIRKFSDSSFSINAFIEGCVKYSEADTSMSVGDDGGINLLATVAAGELSQGCVVSAAVSQKRSKNQADSSHADQDCDGTSRSNNEDPSKHSGVLSDDLPVARVPCSKLGEELPGLVGDAAIALNSSSVDGICPGSGGETGTEKDANEQEFQDQTLDAGQTALSSIAGDNFKNSFPYTKHRDAVELPLGDSSYVEGGMNKSTEELDHNLLAEQKPPGFGGYVIPLSMNKVEPRVTSAVTEDFVPADSDEPKAKNNYKVDPFSERWKNKSTQGLDDNTLEEQTPPGFGGYVRPLGMNKVEPAVTSIVSKDFVPADSDECGAKDGDKIDPFTEGCKSKLTQQLDHSTLAEQKPPGFGGYVRPLSVNMVEPAVTSAVAKYCVPEDSDESKVKNPDKIDAFRDGGKSKSTQQLDHNTLADQKPPGFGGYVGPLSTDKVEPAVTSAVTKDFVPADSDESKDKNANKIEPFCDIEHVEDRKTVQEKEDTIAQKQLSGLGSAASDQKIKCDGGSRDSKCALAHHSVGSDIHASSSASAADEVELHVSSSNSKVVAPQIEQKNEKASPISQAAVCLVPGFNLEAKLELDLNEGFHADDGEQGEQSGSSATNCSPFLSVSPSKLSVCSASGSHFDSISVTVAKDSVVPPVDLLWSKSELGWKGSAATTAFCPAESREAAEIRLDPNNSAPANSASCKQGKRCLDIDLNVADERLLQDDCCQSSSLEMDQKTDHWKCSASGSYAAGLDLDLNRVDGSLDLGLHSPGNGQRLEVSAQPTKEVSSMGLLNGEAGSCRDFDLNDGPAADEVIVEAPSYNPHAYGNIPLQPSFGLQTNSMAIRNCPSWYSAGTSYSAFTTPSVLPDRGRHHLPIVGIGGSSQRMLGGPTVSVSFNPEVYGRSVLSSSSAVAFPTAPFQYPIFPQGASFHVPASTMSSGSANYMDSLSRGNLAAPAQLIGSVPAISSQYPHPSVVTHPHFSNNSGVENYLKWGRQGLDLNSGPGGQDVGGRDDALPLRQRSSIGFPTPVEEQARLHHRNSAGSKRKEPEGGWGFR